MKLAIDISNCHGNGGPHYIRQLLSAADPTLAGFRSVVVWCTPEQTLWLPSRPWLQTRQPRILNLGRLFRLIVQSFWSGHHHGFDVVFAPGGIQAIGAVPVVAMSHNLLPFDKVGRQGAGSVPRIRYFILRLFQTKTFKAADATIVLSQFAAQMIQRTAGTTALKLKVIPNGVGSEFFDLREDREIIDRPFKWLYVSPVSFYKHHKELLAAFRLALDSGLSMELDLVGGGGPTEVADLRKTINSCERLRATTRYHGPVPHSEVKGFFDRADGFVFLSSCENCPLTLLEAMANGLPIVSSNRGVMPEITGDTALLVDPSDIEAVSAAMRRVCVDAQLRLGLGAAAHERVSDWTWASVAERTFGFLADVGRMHRQGQLGANCRVDGP